MHTPTSEWLARFRDELYDVGFDEEFTRDALLIALDSELKLDGLVVAPKVDSDG